MTGADILFLILGIFIIGYAITKGGYELKAFSKIGLHNKARRKVLKTIPLRKITEQEFKLLTPYMHSKKLINLYCYTPRLKKDNVYNISGKYLVEKDARGNIYHSIDNIQVVFPYGMKEAILTNDNFAEVIFTFDFAFVLRLNGVSISKYQTQYDQGENIDNTL